MDAICCVDVPAFSTEEVDRIALFFKSGGGLIVFPGDNTQVQNYNTTLLQALQIPPIEDVVKIPCPDAAYAFKEIDIDHPIFCHHVRT